MKLINFKVEEQIRLGIKTEKGIIGCRTSTHFIVLRAANENGTSNCWRRKGLRQLAELTKQEVSAISEEELVYAPCITQPEKIICVGLNYVDHAKESNMEIPTSPVLFSKFNNTLAAHNQTIVYQRPLRNLIMK